MTPEEKIEKAVLDVFFQGQRVDGRARVRAILVNLVADELEFGAGDLDDMEAVKASSIRERAAEFRRVVEA